MDLGRVLAVGGIALSICLLKSGIENLGGLRWQVEMLCWCSSHLLGQAPSLAPLCLFPAQAACQRYSRLRTGGFP